MHLEDIITSEVRVKILIELFSETGQHLYVRELTRRVGTEINAVRRELKRFSKAGIIKKEKRGNRLYYLIKKDYPLYYDLVSMVAKESGLGKRILESSDQLGKIKLGLLSTEFAEGRHAGRNELDLLIVGEVNLDLLAAIVKQVSEEIEREINYTVLGEEEFEYLKGRRDAFLLSFLISQNILLVGEPAKYLIFK
jgi:DNA-binding transcriptional ArsR family regulator